MFRHFMKSLNTYELYTNKINWSQNRETNLIKKQKMFIHKRSINIMQCVIENVYGSHFLLKYLRNKIK
jgi:hypothetical protein